MLQQCGKKHEDKHYSDGKVANDALVGDLVPVARGSALWIEGIENLDLVLGMRAITPEPEIQSKGEDDPRPLVKQEPVVRHGKCPERVADVGRIKASEDAGIAKRPLRDESKKAGRDQPIREVRLAAEPVDDTFVARVCLAPSL
ncbi:hypothetical protein [Accumulibacter sp.]|uniref:hypothetical protein n=1 Tax=Accumulibacter sp. TaxID=2053492 RepID=UPI001AC453AF|nr:hypothetical protein [Accumulibacter sp.]MBN8453631.1 hypothetical protein [Accumulibacter sp.]